jgi:transcriptional regulator with XRE-family HTH domain
MEPQDWPEKLIALCTSRGWTQKQLAGELGVTPAYLNEVIKGKKEASPWLKLRYYGIAGWDKTMEQVISLLPDDVAQVVRESEKKAIAKIGQKAEARAEKLEAKASKAKRPVPAKKSGA